MSRCIFILLVSFSCAAYAQAISTPAVEDTTLANQYFAQADKLAAAFQFDSSDVYFEKAGELYKRAAQKYEQTQLWEKYVYCNIKIGFRISVTGQFERALTYLTSALEVGLIKLGENHHRIALIYHCLGNIYLSRTDYTQAMAYFEKALKIRKRLYGEIHKDVAESYQTFGITHYTKGDFDAAIRYYNQSIAILEQTPEKSYASIAYACNIIGLSYTNKGDYERGLKYQKKNLESLFKVVKEKHALVAQAYGNIGKVYSLIGDYDTALEYCQKAAAIYSETLGNSYPHPAGALDKIGEIYFEKNELDEAIKHYKQALDFRLRLPGEQRAVIAVSYDQLGIVYQEKSDFTQALTYLTEALDIKHQLHGESHNAGTSCESTHEYLGSLYVKLGDYGLALEHFNKALLLKQSVYGKKNPEVAFSYQRMGDLFHAQGDLTRALRYYQKSLMALVADFADSNIYRNPTSKNVSSKTALLSSLEKKAQALTRRFQQENHNLIDLQTALSCYQLASNLIDRMRSGYEAEGSKIFLGAKASKIYEKALDASMQAREVTPKTRYNDLLFSFAEKSKASVLSLSIQESQAKQFASIPADLLEQENDLKIDLAFYETEIEKEKLKRDKQDKDKLRQFQDRHFALKRDYAELATRIEKSYPRYFELKYKTQTASRVDLQKALDDQTAVLEYFLGDSAVFAFAMTRQGFNVATVKVDSSFHKMITDLANSLKTISSKSIYLQCATRLYQILVKPLESQISTKRRWIIIPDGELSQIPFEALLTNPVAPADQADFRTLPYLIKERDISYHLSATLFLMSRKEQVGTGYKNIFAGFAPVFGASVNNGALLPAEAASFTTVPADASSYLITRDGKNLDELKFSEREVQKIFEQFFYQGRAYLHREASEENFKKNIKGYKYVHVATHGFINNENPKLSNLAFSQPQDRNAPEDGVLYSSETYNLDLNADLLVLSACQTGTGKLVKGEGLMALTRGFLYSGARNIIASLWKVYDQHTSQLMVEMYRQIATSKTYSAALRESKLKMIANEETAAPQSWAGFVLIGR